MYSNSWQPQGLCRDEDPEIFFVDPGQPAVDAKAICVRCPVISECLEWAIETRQHYGVWGGMTQRERESVRRGKKVATIKICGQCQESFIPKNINQVWCSKRCRRRRDYELRHKPIEQIKHHDRRGYQAGCRCPECVADHSEYQNNWRTQRRARKAG